MKKIILVLFAGLILLSFSACSDNTNQNQNNEQSTTNSTSSEKTLGDFLTANFGFLYSEAQYYLDINVNSEKYSENSVLNSSQYNYTLSVDNENYKAYLYISFENGSVGNIMIKDNYGYNIDNTNKIVEKHSFDSENEFVEFTQAYTINMWVGATGGVKLDSSGVTEYNGKSCDYEKYSITIDSSSEDLQNTFITYYFDNGEAVAEIIESPSSKTIFTFNKISKKIPNQSVFEIPNDYKIVDSSEPE